MQTLDTLQRSRLYYLLSLIGVYRPSELQFCPCSSVFFGIYRNLQEDMYF